MSNNFGTKIINIAKKHKINMIHTQLFYIDDHNSNFWIFKILDNKDREGYKFREILRSFCIDINLHKGSEKAALETFEEEIKRWVK
jgi:hypothetical protein